MIIPTSTRVEIAQYVLRIFLFLTDRPIELFFHEGGLVIRIAWTGHKEPGELLTKMEIRDMHTLKEDLMN